MLLMAFSSKLNWCLGLMSSFFTFQFLSSFDRSNSKKVYYSNARIVLILVNVAHFYFFACLPTGLANKKRKIWSCFSIYYRLY
ncbi:hypothetical protein LguiA_016441 [Lonicera macranthoides]